MPQALQFIEEAATWAPRSQAGVPAEAVLGAPNSLWYSVLSADTLLGIIGYVGISWPDGTADVALGVVPSLRKRGVAKALAKAQNHFAFTELGLRRLQMIALSDAPSCKIALAAGLHLEGTLRQARLKEGSYHDASVYALVKGDA